MLLQIIANRRISLYTAIFSYMIAHENTVSNSLSALFEYFCRKILGGTYKFDDNSLCNSYYPIFVRAHIDFVKKSV